MSGKSDEEKIDEGQFDRFSTLHFKERIECSLDVLWEITTEPVTRAMWAAPNSDVNVKFICSETVEGGKETAICQHAGSPDVEVDVTWLAISPQFRTVNSEVVSCEGTKFSAALMTSDYAGDTDESHLAITVQIASFEEDMSENYRQGFEGCLVQLGSIAKRTMLLKRHIAAPAKLIWKAWMDAENLPKWWGPDGFSCRTKRIDLKPGGDWVFDMIGPDGTIYPNHHRYHRIEPERRLSYTLLWGENGPKHADAWASFTEDANGTNVVLGMIFATEEELRHAQGFGAVELGHQTLGKLEAYSLSL